MALEPYDCGMQPGIYNAEMRCPHQSTSGVRPKPAIINSISIRVSVVSNTVISFWPWNQSRQKAVRDLQERAKLLSSSHNKHRLTSFCQRIARDAFDFGRVVVAEGDQPLVGLSPVLARPSGQEGFRCPPYNAFLEAGRY